MTSPHNILYVLSRFPNISTTFIANEMTALAEFGLNIQIAAIWSSLEGSPHPTEKPFLDRVIRLRLGNPALWIGAARAILRKPAVIGAILKLIAGHTVSVWALLKVFANIPKGLYLGEWARQNGIEHIHAHFLTAPATVALIASKVSGVPFTVTIHAFDIFSTHPRTINGAVCCKAESAAALIAISAYNKRYLLDRYKGLNARIEVVYNGIDFALFTPPTNRRPIPRDALILSNGSLIPKKGHDVLIRAVAALRAEGYPVTLHIIGRGILENELKALVESLGVGEAVTFLGTMPQDEIVRYTHAADIFALACVVAPDGDMDGIPTVLIESLAVELPSVSTQVSGVPEILIDGETGLCVASGDVDAFKDALKWMIDHPDAARAIAQRGRSHVLGRFDRRANVKKLHEIWSKTM